MKHRRRQPEQIAQALPATIRRIRHETTRNPFEKTLPVTKEPPCTPLGGKYGKWGRRERLLEQILPSQSNSKRTRGRLATTASHFATAVQPGFDMAVGYFAARTSRSAAPRAKSSIPSTNTRTWHA